MEATLASGLLVLDDSGQVVRAQGLGTEPGLQAAIAKRLAAASPASVGAWALKGPTPLLVAHRSVGTNTVCLILPDPAHDAGPAGTAWIASADRSDALSRASHDSGLDDIIGSSEAIQQLKSDIRKIAPLEVGVLIVGESGTGKELAALALHALSKRRSNRMVFVNAAALPGSLVESELFGYEPGAFTGAERMGRKGKFELAHGSSLFFDEIGDMPPEIQVKLLRVMQDGMFERVGGHKPQHSDFRLICASNRDFQQLIHKNQFRLDLYYRISGVTLRMPSLRERLSDIPELVTHFLAAFARRHRTSPKAVDPRVHEFLRSQRWPGNVRQLLHEVERAAIFCEGQVIRPVDFRHSDGLSPQPRMPDEPNDSSLPAPASPNTTPAASPAPRTNSRVQGVRAARDELELQMIREALIRHNGNKVKVAAELGISRTYLYKRLNSE